MPRRRPRRPTAHPLEDPGFARQVSRLLEEQRSALPADADLAAAADVSEQDVLAAERLWDAAQQRGGTGLAGLLSADTERA